ncbi:hypothetical protein HPB47_027703 [Ixodes persulcatus]|uniref:Uncharacterized protein n=1 Tax=Ixodes persulcatus TaxID=34615 RepID=A0AC60PV88_IXOPE|nr:hypothetical protein HPB47_027703 [Ixodes persulcatus]
MVPRRTGFSATHETPQRNRFRTDVKKASKTVLTTDQAPEVDPHLLHLWDARHGLTKRWKKQKQNRTLRKRIAELTQEAEQYAEDHTQANWHRMCDQLQAR